MHRSHNEVDDAVVVRRISVQHVQLSPEVVPVLPPATVSIEPDLVEGHGLKVRGDSYSGMACC